MRRRRRAGWRRWGGDLTALLLLFLLLAAGAGWARGWIQRQVLALQPAAAGKMAPLVQGQAWLARPATVVAAPVGGPVVWYRTEGRQLPAAERVVSFPELEAGALAAKLQALEEEKRRLERELAASPGRDAAGGELAAAVSAFRRERSAAVAGREALAWSASLRSRWDGVLREAERFQDAVRREQAYRLRAPRLEAELRSAVQLLEDDSGLRMPEAGVLLRSRYQWEERLAAGVLPDREAFSRPQLLWDSRRASRLAAGDPAFASASPWSGMFALLLPASQVGLLPAPGSELRLASADGTPAGAWTARIREVGAAAGGMQLILLESDDVGLLPPRWQGEARLLLPEREGVLVPSSALIREESGTGVFIWASGQLQFRPVRLLAERDGWALVEGIDPGSEVAAQTFWAKFWG